MLGVSDVGWNETYRAGRGRWKGEAWARLIQDIIWNELIRQRFEGGVAWVHGKL